MKSRVLILFTKFSWLDCILQRLTVSRPLTTAPSHHITPLYVFAEHPDSWGCQSTFWFARSWSYSGTPCPAAPTCGAVEMGYFLWPTMIWDSLVAWALKYSLPRLFSPVHMMIRSASVILGLELSDENYLLVRSFIIFDSFMLYFIFYVIICRNHWWRVN